MKHKKLSLDVKELEDDGTFSGYVAVTGTEDRQGDIIESGAFRKTNQENDTFPLLWQHKRETPIGVIKEVEEDSKGQWVKGELNLDTQKGKEAYSLLKQEAIKGLSIGYKTIKDKIEEGVRIIKELKLFEGSLVTFPANPLAQVEAVKTVPQMQEIPLAERDREWNGNQAVENLRVWAGGPEKEDIDWDMYRKGFLWYDGDNPELYGSYKLPYGDIINGELRAVPRGLFAVTGAVRGARGNRVDVPEDELPRIKNRLENWYARMRKKFGDEDIIVPWREENSLGSKLYEVLGIIEYQKDGINQKLVGEVVNELKTLRGEGEPSPDTQDSTEAVNKGQESGSTTLDDVVEEITDYIDSNS